MITPTLLFSRLYHVIHIKITTSVHAHISTITQNNPHRPKDHPQIIIAESTTN